MPTCAVSCALLRASSVSPILNAQAIVSAKPDMSGFLLGLLGRDIASGHHSVFRACHDTRTAFINSGLFFEPYAHGNGARNQREVNLAVSYKALGVIGCDRQLFSVLSFLPFPLLLLCSCFFSFSSSPPLSFIPRSSTFYSSTLFESTFPHYHVRLRNQKISRHFVRDGPDGHVFRHGSPDYQRRR